MDHQHVDQCTAFEGSRRIASGELRQVALKAKTIIDADPTTTVLIFDDATSHTVEIDWRGTPEQVLHRLAPPNPGIVTTEEQDSQEAAPRGRGRPKLGVVAREVTLLPRHWDWLNTQPGGASVALRKLVEQAKRGSSERDRLRQAQEAAFRFMSVMAGGLPGFEEATRALFAGDGGRFDQLTAAWPTDVRDHARQLALPALHSPDAQKVEKTQSNA